MSDITLLGTGSPDKCPLNGGIIVGMVGGGVTVFFLHARSIVD